MKAVSASEMAGAVLPSWAQHKVLAVLYGYFDESGTHPSSNTHVIAGFVGPAKEWDDLEHRWRAALSELRAPPFHYSELKNQTGPFSRCSRDWADLICTRCANEISRSGLHAFAAGFLGDFDRAISMDPGVYSPPWRARFPSAYSWVFEICINEVDRVSREHWGGEPVALIFSAQNEFSERAVEVWNRVKKYGFYPTIHSMTYERREDQPRLDIADMLAFEVYQTIHDQDPHLNESWHLMRTWIKSDRILSGWREYEDNVVHKMTEAEKNGRGYFY